MDRSLPASTNIEGLNIEDLGKDKRKIREAWGKEHKLQELLRKFRSSPWPSSKCCIFRVPEKLQKSYKEAYTPRVVAIGPYHRGNQSLERMESDKLLYLSSFSPPRRRPLHEYIEKIESSIGEIKSCYDEQISLKNDDLANVMVLDGIFMIQLFLIHGKRMPRPEGDRIFDRPWMLNNVRRDMMLLENQMPFFVIKGLFEMAYGSHVPDLLQLVYGFFSPVMMPDVPRTVQGSEVKHFLDAIRFSYLSSVRRKPCTPKATDPEGAGVDPEVAGVKLRKSKSKRLLDIKRLRRETRERETPKEIEIKFIPNATDLVGAGVKLRKSKSKYLHDVKFENGVLEIPPFNLHRITQSYVRNVIAFEQCYYEEDSYLIDYLVFIDQLVNVPADAKLLIDEGIIENWLSSEHAAADLINSYCKDIGLWPRDTYFDTLRQKLIEHYQWPYNEWKATFKRDYCNSPWKVLSVIAAVVLLALTFVQTMCSLPSMK